LILFVPEGYTEVMPNFIYFIYFENIQHFFHNGSCLTSFYSLPTISARNATIPYPVLRSKEQEQCRQTKLSQE